MKRLYRSQNDRKLAGILGGLGEYFNIDPTIIRLAYLVGLIMSFGALFIVYFLAIFIIPNEWEVR